jgi:hypothetical protein
MTELTVMVPEKGPEPDALPKTGTASKKKRLVETPFFSEGTKRFFGMVENPTIWNEFFVEWVCYPFTQRLRRAFMEIDDRLRVLDPSILPQWSRLEEVWTGVGACEDGVSLLPTKVEYAYRLDDEKAPSARLITEWRQLKKIASREARPESNVQAGYVDAPKARRRRRGG